MYFAIYALSRQRVFDEKLSNSTAIRGLSWDGFVDLLPYVIVEGKQETVKTVGFAFCRILWSLKILLNNWKPRPSACRP